MTGTEPTQRPAYATRACYLAIALTVGFGLLNLIVAFTGPTGTDTALGTGLRVFSVALDLATLIAGLAAATRTLNGSNGWRIALIVFGWLTVAQGICLIIGGALAGVQLHTVDSAGNRITTQFPSHTWWIVWGAVWATGAALCSIWLSRKDVAAWTKPPTPAVAAPAGWYPGPNDTPLYWTGKQWAVQIPPPTDPI
jgi:hypothetical protein